MTYIPLTTPLSEIINKNTFNGIFAEERMEKFIIPNKDFDRAIAEIKQRLNFKLKK